MPSATTADSSDSIAPSSAMVKAGPTRENTCAMVTDGNENEAAFAYAAEGGADGGDPLEPAEILNHGDHDERDQGRGNTPQKARAEGQYA